MSERAVSDLERGINRTARKDTALLLAGALGLDGRARDLFVAAARGRRLSEAGSQALQGIRRVGGRVLTPNPVDERRLRDYVTWLEREGDQQRAQPGARHVGGDAVARSNLE